MKRAVFCVLLVILMLLSSYGIADLEIPNQDSYKITTATVKGDYSSVFNKNTHTIGIEQSNAWHLFDANGKIISQAYNNMKSIYDAPFYAVTKAGKDGIIDAEGNVVVPVSYGDVEAVSSRWTYGVTLVPTGTDQGDYYTTATSGRKTYYNADTYDFYYCGNMVGSLPRSGFTDYATAYGDYLQIRDRNGLYHHYSKEFVDSKINEYGETYYANRSTKHTGTGQTMWTDSCTLTPDEVKTAYNTDSGYVVDLQGNRLFPYSYSYVSTFYNGVARFKTNQGMYGIVNIDGKELVPGIYDDIDYSYEYGIDIGYFGVTKNGLAGFVSAEGKETENSFLYPSNVVTVKTPFMYAKGMDGKYLVITATVGELEQHFEDVRFPGYGCPLFVGKTSDGAVAVYGINGEVVMKNTNWDDTYDIDISYDGRFAYDYVRVDGQYVYTLYTIDYLAPEKPAQEDDTGSEKTELAEGHWICPTCGEERDTAFCPQDGTPRPAEPATWICPVCGNEIDTPFCPNDGTKKN